MSKDEPQKPAPIRFFEILWRKLSKLSLANLLFLIPVVIVGGIIYLLILMPYQPVYVFTISGSEFLFNLWQMYVMPLPLILLSPFWGGLTFISRNFVREEHAFVASDFWKTVKSNWKALLINGVICYLAYVILSFSFIFYFSLLSSSAFFYVPLAISLFITILFIFAQYYIPVMIITFDLKLRQIYKNAFILALLGGLRNLLMTIFFLALLLGAYLSLALGPVFFIALLLMILILFAFCNYLINFAAYPLIDKYLIQPQISKDTALEKAESDGEILENKPAQSEKSEEDEYVYINGRLIKKSDAEDKNL